MIYSPLEQFQIYPIVSIYLFSFLDLSISTVIFYMFFIIFFILFYFSFFYSKGGLLYYKNKYISKIIIIFEKIYFIIINLLKDNVGSQGILYFPIIYTLFIYIALSNLIGMIPFTMTITSQLIITFTLAFAFFFGINVIGYSIHKEKLLNLFFPPGSPFILAPLLIIIEFVSYIFRVFSLSVRLFANMMAGHSLLKILAGFGWNFIIKVYNIMNTSQYPIYPKFLIFLDITFIFLIFKFTLLPLLSILIGLELGIAIIQAYVFTTLICIYLNDALHLH